MKELNQNQKELVAICSLAILRVVNSNPHDRATLKTILQSEQHLLSNLVKVEEVTENKN